MPAMRKWVVIGSGVVLLVAVGVVLLARPTPDTVEYHKAKYLATYKELEGNPGILTHAKFLYFRLRGNAERVAAWKAEEAGEERLRQHRDALVRLKYLQRRTFIVGDTPIGDLYNLPSKADPDTEQPFVHFSLEGPTQITNVTVVCLPKHMDQFEQFTKRAVLPESK